MDTQKRSRCNGRKSRRLRISYIRFVGPTRSLACSHSDSNGAYVQRNRPSFLHLRLKHSITAQDDLSERIASAFIQGRPIPPGMGGSDRAPTAVSGFASQGGGSGSGVASRVDSPAPGERSGTPTMGDRVSVHHWMQSGTRDRL